jgi:hypothetical protein
MVSWFQRRWRLFLSKRQWKKAIKSVGLTYHRTWDYNCHYCGGWDYKLHKDKIITVPSGETFSANYTVAYVCLRCEDIQRCFLSGTYESLLDLLKAYGLENQLEVQLLKQRQTYLISETEKVEKKLAEYEPTTKLLKCGPYRTRSINDV